MYGTVAKLTFRSGAREDALRHLTQRYEHERLPGAVASYAYQTDADPDVWYLAVMFDGKESYWANARSPEQNSRFTELRALLATDPEWHDGEVVQVFKV